MRGIQGGCAGLRLCSYVLCISDNSCMLGPVGETQPHDSDKTHKDAHTGRQSCILWTLIPVCVPRATVTFVREMPPDRCSHYACGCLHVLFFFVCVCLWSLPCCLLDWKNNNQQQIWKHAVSSMHLHLTAQAHTCTTSQISSRASVPVFRLMSVAAYDKKKKKIICVWNW